MAKIVVIEDDEQFRLFLTELLQNLGYEVVSAANGMIGLEAINKEAPDLVITDIIMPETEGVEVIVNMRSNNIKTPIIAISGGSLGKPETYLNMATKLGANAILMKPFDADDLVFKVESLLKCA